MRNAPVLLVAIVVGCGGGGGGAKPVKPAAPVAKVDVAPAVKEELVSPVLRLPPLARPISNAVDLTIDPTTEDFTGTITSAIEVLKPTDVIWLNGLELVIDRVTLTPKRGGAAIEGKGTAPAKDYVALQFPSALAPGMYQLAITYRGKMHVGDGDGIYTMHEAGEWYAVTQFENTDARQAFPTFDEPSYKVPWRLTLHVKQGLMAIANTPIVKETTEAGGMKAVEFAETKPLPSYLVAFAVGPWEVVGAGSTRSGAPIRVVVPRGRTADAAYAAQATAPLLGLLENYFGSPYPFAKLDIVSVPIFNAGAMENPGMITFKQDLLLSKPADLTDNRRKTYAIVVAHEMAHQWFGDDVTLAWWDDTWLNESFASWMETKIVAAWKPDWDMDVAMVENRAEAMGFDSLETARAIRMPVESTNDILSSFDEITYKKGEAVLRMVERYVGEDVFRKGVQAYLKKFSGKNTTYADFVGELGAAAGKDLAPLFDAFVKQPGIPFVSVATSCKTGEAPKVELAQHRYAPLGSDIAKAHAWPLPVCVRWGAGAGKATGRDCVLLDPAAEKTELTLGAKTCPDWVLPNEGELGYYYWQPVGDVATKLLAHLPALTLPERIGVLGDVGALVGSGDLQTGVALGLVDRLAKEKSRQVVSASIGIVAGIDESVPDKLRPNYERFIVKTYAARAKELGWKARAGEGADTKQLRPTLMRLVAGVGRVKPLIAEATALAWKWLDQDRAAVDPEMVNTVLHIAARYGDQKLFDRLLAEAKKATSDERERYVAALGAFVDPKIVQQAMAIVLTDTFDVRESGGLMNFGDPLTRPAAFAFAQAHFDEILAKLPAPFRAYMAFLIVPICDEDKKAELEAWIKPKIEKLEGGPLILSQALEQLTLCSAARKAQAPGIAAFLAKQ